ncbi:MAG: hypothetical protein ABIR50_08335 [Ginsengibacter sp.]
MKINQRFLFLVIAFSFQTIANAASVDTINIYSNAMHKRSKCVIIFPDTYKDGNRFPVV